MFDINMAYQIPDDPKSVNNLKKYTNGILRIHNLVMVKINVNFVLPVPLNVPTYV